MNGSNLDHLPANRKLLLHTLLKNRVDVSGAASSRSPGQDDDHQEERTHHDRGVFGDACVGDGAGPGTGPEPPRSPRQSLPNFLWNNPLLKMARVLLEKSTQMQGPGSHHIHHQSPLICMRGEGTRIPFFCVHALLGSSFHYFALANLLDHDQPFYALQAPGLDGSEPPLTRIEDFAAHYIGFIRQVQPKGPYRIGGYSFGGLVAFEIARQLAKAGDAVSRLILFGTDVPLSVSNASLFKILDFLGKYSSDFHRNLIAPFFSYEKRVGRPEGSRRLPFSPTLVNVVTAHCLAALRYNPRPYPGRITLLETLEQQIISPLDPSRGWDRLTCRDVDTLVVSGNHLSMLDEPHIRDLADKLNLCLSGS